MTDFDALARSHRAELHAHCYRMLGSLADAEDVVQEALLRAWKGIAGFENRASLRTWLFRITTNACIDALAKRSPRFVPQQRFAAADPAAPFGAPLPPSELVDPYPGAPWGLSVGRAGEANVVTRESVALAFVAALQHLPPLQRAVLLLRDVLEMSAAESAALLEKSSASVESALERARAAMADKQITATIGDLAPPKRELLTRYLRAWEARDPEALAALLRDDAIMTMPPFATWYAGKSAITAFARALMPHLPEMRGQLIDIDGAQGIALWKRVPGTDQFVADAIAAVKLDGDQVVAVDSFLSPQLFRFFGLPETLP